MCPGLAREGSNPSPSLIYDVYDYGYIIIDVCSITRSKIDNSDIVDGGDVHTKGIPQYAMAVGVPAKAIGFPISAKDHR